LKKISIFLNILFLNFLVLVFILSFKSLSIAQDISEFEIEGRRVGDSLLKFYSEKEIREGAHAIEFKDNTYTQTTFYPSTLETYEGITVSYKTTDKKYIIVGLGGALSCKNNIEKCYKKQNEIINDLKKMFTNLEVNGPVKKDLSWSNTGSTTTQTHMEFTDGDIIGVQSYEFSKEDRKNKNANHFLRVNIFNAEYNYWLVNVAYK